MSIAAIIELVVIAIILILVLAYVIVKAVRNKWLSQLKDTVKASIKEAEASGKSGKEKKDFVLEKIKEKCKELEIPYTLIYKLVSILINTIIEHYNYIAK